MERDLRLANVIRNVARYTLLIVGILVLVFALISGSESYGGGIMGLIKNSPNALPWLILFVFIFVAWKWELTGGIIITLFGVAMFFFFNQGPNFYMATLFLSLLIIALGSFFILSWYLRRGNHS